MFNAPARGDAANGNKSPQSQALRRFLITALSGATLPRVAALAWPAIKLMGLDPGARLGK